MPRFVVMVMVAGALSVRVVVLVLGVVALLALTMVAFGAVAVLAVMTVVLRVGCAGAVIRWGSSAYAAGSGAQTGAGQQDDEQGEMMLHIESLILGHMGCLWGASRSSGAAGGVAGKCEGRGPASLIGP